MKKIAIVNSSSFGVHFSDHLERLKAIGTVERYTFPIDVDALTLAETIGDVEYIIASVTPTFPASFFAQMPHLRLISRHGIGFNNVDVKAATDHGVYVTIVPGLVEQDAVAENAVALLMSLSRRIVESYDAAKTGNWKLRSKFMGYQFSGKTTGVIGLGNIGSRVAAIMHGGFKNTILAYDPNKSAEQIRALGAHPVTLDELLSKSDFISLNAFLDGSSRHLLGEHEFSQMKPSVLITNSARGELVDLPALLQALDTKRIAGYAADVAEGEPVGPDYPLFKYENVILTPHTSAYTWECLRGMGDKCVDDVERVQQGLVPHNVVNQEVILPEEGHD